MATRRKCTRMKRVRVRGHMSKVCASYGKKSGGRRKRAKKGCSYGRRKNGRCPSRKR
jgi:hypothetical protein